LIPFPLGEKMNRQEEHKSRVSKYPKDVACAHNHSANHRIEIENSIFCGCFYCTLTFPSKAIMEWIDEDDEGVGQTALCPKCGIDSVIGDKSGYPITKDFLSEMKRYWF
jgi:hypothetical protein